MKKPDHITQKDWVAVESPPLTETELASLRPLRQADPELAEWSEKRRRGQRGKQKAPTKVATALRIDPDVLDAYKATGRGWNARMNDALRKGIEFL